MRSTIFQQHNPIVKQIRYNARENTMTVSTCSQSNLESILKSNPSQTPFELLHFVKNLTKHNVEKFVVFKKCGENVNMLFLDCFPLYQGIISDIHNLLRVQYSDSIFAILAWNGSPKYGPNLSKKHCLTMF